MARSSGTYHHGNLKSALILAGLDILKTEGIHRLTLRAVARKAKVSHAAPYSHFSGKQDLLANIAIEGFKKLKTALTGNSAYRNIKGKQDLLDFAWQYLTFVLQNPGFYKVMFGELIHPSEHEELGRISMETFHLLIETIQSAQNNMVVQEGDPYEFALSAWTAIHGMADLLLSSVIPAPDKGCKVSPRQFAREISDLCMSRIFEGYRIRY